MLERVLQARTQRGIPSVGCSLGELAREIKHLPEYRGSSQLDELRRRAKLTKAFKSISR